MFRNAERTFTNAERTFPTAERRFTNAERRFTIAEHRMNTTFCYFNNYYSNTFTIANLLLL